MAKSNQALRDTLRATRSSAAADQSLTRAGLAETKRQFAEAQRARVDIAEFSPFEITEGNRGSVWITLRNAGHVAAVGVKARGALLIAELEDLPEGIAVPETVKEVASIGVVPPGHIAHGEIHGFGPPPEGFTATRIKAIETGQMRLFAYGYGEYSDGFGVTRYFRFCRIHRSRDFWRFCGTNNGEQPSQESQGYQP